MSVDKIANGSINSDKLANNAVNSDKIADGSVTGADINSGSVPFSRVVTQIRGTVQVPFTSGGVYPFNNGGYTQIAGEDNQFIGALEVNFAATCNSPRSATAYLLVDPANPAVLSIPELGGIGTVTDNGTGSATRRLEFAPLAGGAGLTKFAPAANTQHTLSLSISPPLAAAPAVA